jgi:4-methyl-5(b-hydroxyethyl)-thiazole monophosphate biosynthesis
MANVIVPLAQGCEELEAVTIIDLLRRAGIEVTSAGLEEGPVRASRGVVLMPDMTLEQALARQYDMVVLPGGLPGADHLANDARIIALVQDTAQRGGFTAAICAAPRVLARAGLLDNRSATSFPGAIDIGAIPGIEYLEQPVVIDGRIVTSRGPGTALDFALALIELLAGGETRAQVEAALQRPR